MVDFGPIDSRARRAAASAALSVFAACGDSTAPAGGFAFYRLATVNSSSLPYLCPPSNSTSYSCALYGGDLLLRPNATFALAIDGVPFLPRRLRLAVGEGRSVLPAATGRVITAYLASGDSLRDESEGISFGSFTSVGGWAVLRRYVVPIPSQTPLDSLAIAGGTLTRTTRLIIGNPVERYSRIR